MTEQTSAPEGVTSAAPAPAAPQPGTPEYATAMATRYDNQGGKPDGVPAKPEGGHDKFYNATTGEYNQTAHDQEKAWQEQQRATQPKADDFIKEPPKADPLNIGESLRSFTNAVASNDREASRQIAQQLIAAGVAPESLEMQVEAVRTTQQGKVREVMEYAGGEAVVAQMKVFAQRNLKPEEAQSYREALGGPNWKMAVDSLRSRMGDGRPSLNMDGGNGGMTDAQPFASRMEMTEAMKDKRYRTDPAYRNSVIKRVSLMQ